VDLATRTKYVWLDFSSEVATGGDRGSTSLTVHPDFAQHPYVYFVFVVTNGGFPTRATSQRLDRVRDDQGYPAIVNGTIDRVSLLGKNVTDAPALCYSSHSEFLSFCSIHFSFIIKFKKKKNKNESTNKKITAIDSVRFGHDGSLLISAGDGAHYEFDVSVNWCSK
jgi:hypothetical protein